MLGYFNSYTFIVFQVLGYIKSGIDEGANLRAGGAKWGDKGFFVQPTVFR